MDYEKACKRCGKCCTPGFEFKGEFVRLKSLRCNYLGDDDLCTIYENRKKIVNCLSPWEMPKGWMPKGCPFHGNIREIEGDEEEEFLVSPSWELRLVYKTALFKWR
jgi:uncharacterized cysteine cluster protein YcgN (CxxCxxCC family)